MTKYFRPFMYAIAITFSLPFPIPSTRNSIPVPKAKYLFSPSASPHGKELLVYVSEQVPEWETTSGYPTFLQIESEPPRIRRLSTAETQDTFTPPRWTSDGKMVFFVTSEGLNVMNAQTREVRLLRKGTLAGLATSPDDSKLAYWNLSPDTERHYLLEVSDYKSGKNVRSWLLETKFESDQYGYEITFSTDGRSLFARTYDTEGSTPLKQFYLETGLTKLLVEDCYGLASSRDSVYFVQARGEERSLLKTADGDGHVIQVVPSFPYDKLAVSGTQRWIVAQELRSRKLALVDTSKDDVRILDGKCDSATVLGDDEVLYLSRGTVSTTPSACGVLRR